MDIEDNAFINVGHLFEQAQSDNNINIDSSNTFENSDAILPYLSDDFYYIKYDRELLMHRFMIKVCVLTASIAFCVNSTIIMSSFLRDYYETI